MKKIIIFILVVLVTSCIPELIPPNVEIVTPSEGSEYTVGEIVNVRVEASDDDGAIADLKLYVDETGVASGAAFPYLFSFPTEDMEAGTHTIKVVATDDDGKESEATSDFVLSSTLPVVTLDQPGVILSDSVVLSGNILSDGGSPITKAGILWGTGLDDVSTYSEITTVPVKGAFKVTLTTLSSASVHALAFADNENGRSFSELRSFTTLVNEYPVCNILAPINGSEFIYGDEIEILLHVSDKENNLAEVRIYVDLAGITTLNSFPYNYSLPTQSLEAGSHILMVEAEDAAGNISSANLIFNLAPSLPELETLEAVSITSNGAVAGGIILNDGGSPNTATGILWGTGTYDGENYEDMAANRTGDSFSVSLGGLEYGKS